MGPLQFGARLLTLSHCLGLCAACTSDRKEEALLRESRPICIIRMTTMGPLLPRLVLGILGSLSPSRIGSAQRNTEGEEESVS